MKPIPAILCVDDDEDDLCFLQETIQSQFHMQAVTKTSGAEALLLLRQWEQLNQLPSLVILDMNMPGLDGKEMVRRIRTTRGMEHLPIAVFSTSNRPKDREYFEDEGITYVTKPFGYQQMKGAIHQLLAWSGLASV